MAQRVLAVPVSILARPEGRALLDVKEVLSRFLGFQSSPVPKDGRYGSFFCPVKGELCFNPRPSRRTGATGTHCRGYHHEVFQSSPVPKDGRYRGSDEQPRVFHIVSILARPEGRALPVPNVENTSMNWFQSSPVPKDGRYYVAGSMAADHRSFNPRPSRRTGATRWGKTQSVPY